MYTAIYISISQYQYVEKVIEANSQKLLGRENIGRSLYILFWNFSKIEIDKRAIFLTSLLI